MCGKNIGYEIARFLLATEHTVRFVVNDYERPGQWYRTPRELPIVEIPESQAVAFAPDLLLVAFYDRILKEPLFTLPPLGAWNLHLGDAEKYRGAYPNIWALRNGDSSYAVTLHRIDKGVDTGPILAKREFPIPAEFTGKDLYQRMVEAGRDLLIASFDALISGLALQQTRPQSNAHAITHYRKELTHELQVSEAFKNQVRALTFPPFPPPYFMIGSRKFVIIEETPPATKQNS